MDIRHSMVHATFSTGQRDIDVATFRPFTEEIALEEAP